MSRRHNFYFIFEIKHNTTLAASQPHQWSKGIRIRWWDVAKTTERRRSAHKHKYDMRNGERPKRTECKRMKLKSAPHLQLAFGRVGVESHWMCNWMSENANLLQTFRIDYSTIVNTHTPWTTRYTRVIFMEMFVACNGYFITALFLPSRNGVWTRYFMEIFSYDT